MSVVQLHRVLQKNNRHGESHSPQMQNFEESSDDEVGVADNAADTVENAADVDARANFRHAVIIINRCDVNRDHQTATAGGEVVKI